MILTENLIRKTAICEVIFFACLTSGGSSGIGRAATILLSKLGCSVAFGGRNKANLDDVAANCVETKSDAQVGKLFLKYGNCSPSFITLME